MIVRHIISELNAKIREFRAASSGNLSVMFALSLVPIVSSVGAGVDYSQANSIKSAMLAAADSAALGTVKIASTLTTAAVQSTAVGIFNASFNRPGITPTVNVSYNSASKTITVSASATYNPSFMKLVGISQMNMSATSQATIGVKKWQVCVDVTDPDSGHTLLVKNGSHIDFNNCLVQVNTLNWDAVEARDTSYIHSTNGVNCFVGDIHYGDVTPPKDPTCTFFTDPFGTYNISTNACTYTNKSVTAPATLTPGTYCGGINISKDVTFSPGVYYIQDGDFVVTGSANIIANNVTFLISGSNSNINITTSGTLTMSPNIDAGAGQWAGFLFYYDQPSAKNNKVSTKQGDNWIKNAKLNGSGIIYLVNQKLNITNGAVVTLKPGSILADFILPDSGGILDLTGDLNSPLMVLAAMQKAQGTSVGGPTLVK